MPWFDVDDDSYAGQLPPDVRQQWERLQSTNTDTSGIRLCREVAAAAAMLTYANRRVAANELIALRSARLAEVKGTIRAKEIGLEWIGYDVVSLGWWSLLEGLFWAPSAFPGWMVRVNGDGLLPDRETARAFIEAYRTAERAGDVEEIPEAEADTALIEIARVVDLHPIP